MKNEEAPSHDQGRLAAQSSSDAMPIPNAEHGASHDLRIAILGCIILSVVIVAGSIQLLGASVPVPSWLLFLLGLIGILLGLGIPMLSGNKRLLVVGGALTCLTTIIVPLAAISYEPPVPPLPPGVRGTPPVKADRTRPTRVPEVIYSVSGQIPEGASVVEFDVGGSVEQEFVAARPELVEVAITTASNPKWGNPVPSDSCPNGSIGMIQYDIVDGAAPIIEPISSGGLAACQNTETVWLLPAPASLATGRTYTLRITNIGSPYLSIYFNSNRRTAPGRTFLTGAVSPRGRQVPYEKAVAGTISAR